jgi:hypothetical protein
LLCKSSISQGNTFNLFVFLAPTSSEEFQEIEGESEERRRARFERNQRTRERAVMLLWFHLKIENLLWLSITSCYRG